MSPPRGEVLAQLDPVYWTNPDKATGGQLLMLRHEGLGWLSYILPPAERDRLAGYLAKAQEMNPSSESTPTGSGLH